MTLSPWFSVREEDMDLEMSLMSMAEATESLLMLSAERGAKEKHEWYEGYFI